MEEIPKLISGLKDKEPTIELKGGEVPSADELFKEKLKTMTLNEITELALLAHLDASGGDKVQAGKTIGRSRNWIYMKLHQMDIFEKFRKK